MTFPAGSGAGFGIVQFRLSRDVAEAVDVDTLRVRGAAAGVPDPQIECSTKHVRGGGCRITCRIPMAVFIEQEISRVMETTAKTTLAIDCAAASMAILNALEPSRLKT